MSVGSTTLEAVADVLSGYKECPTHSESTIDYENLPMLLVPYSILEVIPAFDIARTLLRFQGILQSFSVDSPESITRFARWIRSILLTIFHREEGDRADESAKYFVQALGVLRMPAAAKVPLGASFPPSSS
jgi:hypothetical protein